MSMESMKSRVELWIRDQSQRMGISWPPPMPQPLPQWKWPPWKAREDRREQERLLRDEYERQRQRLTDICGAIKAESLADLQEVLCSMVLSECVYKRPATEMLRFINKFKSDFGGQIVSIERVQPSLDHVPHRYLLAEAGDTLFASFIGTKQYKDVIADVNIFQGEIFHDDNAEEFDVIDAIESNQPDTQRKSEETLGNTQGRKKSKPAAHRGFLARAKGIPALELYKLALKKKRKLVLCGHSLGGAVAALATLAILRVLASTPLLKFIPLERREMASSSSSWGLAMAVFFMVMISSSAAVLKVGDSIGWTIMGKIDYAGWAANNTFHVGDTLLFVYNKAFHNVMEVKKADYNGCTAKSPISTQATGNDSIILKTEGDHYFLCGVPGHCQIGQKLMVKALAKGSSAAPSTAPAGAPASAPAPPSGGSGSAAGGSVSPAPSPKTSDATAASYKGLGLIVSAVAVAAGLVMS